MSDSELAIRIAALIGMFVLVYGGLFYFFIYPAIRQDSEEARSEKEANK